MAVYSYGARYWLYFFGGMVMMAAFFVGLGMYIKAILPTFFISRSMPTANADCLTVI